MKLEGFSGGDRTSIDLPAAQEELLKALASTGKPLVVVLQNGSALAVNWAQQNANAILEAWYPGEEGGTAIAETLAGDNNPGGRLPLTFYSSLSQVPPFEEYSMRDRTYRYFTGQPLYGFGFGLSYTSFAYEHLKIAPSQVKAGNPVEVQADVRNTGAVPGDEVVELYLTQPSAWRLRCACLRDSTACAWPRASQLTSALPSIRALWARSIRKAIASSCLENTASRWVVRNLRMQPRF